MQKFYGALFVENVRKGFVKFLTAESVSGCETHVEARAQAHVETHVEAHVDEVPNNQYFPRGWYILLFRCISGGGGIGVIEFRITNRSPLMKDGP